MVLHSLFNADVLGWNVFRAAYVDERNRVRELAASSDGGNLYNMAPVRASKRFTRAILADVHEGRNSQGEASRLVGARKSATLEQLAEHVGVA